MRFYTKQHQFYCGIDLRARTMYVCIMDHEGTILIHRNMPAAADALADVPQPYCEDLALAVECIFTRYWVADLCSRIGVEFVLGHALYMKTIHGGKVKNDQYLRTQAGSWGTEEGWFIRLCDEADCQGYICPLTSGAL